MPLTSDQMQSASEVFGASPTLRDGVANWRARYPAIRVVQVDAMDMREETPALQLGSRQLWLASSAGHCWRLTSDLAEASVLVVAELALPPALAGAPVHQPEAFHGH